MPFEEGFFNMLIPIPGDYFMSYTCNWNKF